MSTRHHPWARAAMPWIGTDEEGTAAGIYGVIVGAAVMAASHADRIATIAAAVLVTLVVYWTAERFVRLVAGRIHEGRPPTWRHVCTELTRGWQMVSTSGLPLVVLVLASGLGADTSRAVFAALGCSTVLLCLTGWEIGRGGQLGTGERIASAVVAGLFGVGMILMKTLLH